MCVLACVCACGFVGAKHLYNNVINIINEQHVSIHNRGDSLTVQQGSVTASAWKDRKVVTVLSTTTQATANGTVLRRQKDGSRIPVPSSLRVSSWEGWIVKTSSEGTTGAAQKVENFISIYSTFYSTLRLPMHLYCTSTMLPAPSSRTSEIFVCSWQRSLSATTAVVGGLVGRGPS